MTPDSLSELERARAGRRRAGLPKYDWQRCLDDKELAYFSKLLETIKPFPGSPMAREFSIYDKLKQFLNSDNPINQQWAKRFLLKLEKHRDLNILKSTCKRIKPYRRQPLYKKSYSQRLAECLASPDPRLRQKGEAMKKLMDWQLKNDPRFKALSEKNKPKKK